MPELDASYHDPRISMNHWWPRLAELDVPTPDTELIPVTYSDEGPQPVEWDTDALVAAMDGFSTDRAFIRTDLKSARFMTEGAYIYQATPEAVDETVMCLLLQMSDMDFLSGSFAIREWLALDTYAECYNQPVAPEVRFFIDEGEVICSHLRTTEEDFDSSVDAPRDILVEMGTVAMQDQKMLREYAETIATEFDEAGWSVDFVRTEDGSWYCTDMALYGLYFYDMDDEEDGFWKSISHHESGCPHNLQENLPDDLPAHPENARTARLDDQ